jgi:hypothetical protein
MTARLAFTQRAIRTAIAAARKEGLCVHGIKPDGTVMVGDKPRPDGAATLVPADNAPSSRWGDVET